MPMLKVSAKLCFCAKENKRWAYHERRDNEKERGEEEERELIVIEWEKRCKSRWFHYTSIVYGGKIVFAYDLIELIGTTFNIL